MSDGGQRLRRELAALTDKRIREVKRIGDPEDERLTPDAPSIVLQTDGSAYIIVTDWRLIANGRVQVTSLEHGQIYGMKEPIDAIGKLTQALEGAIIKLAAIDEETGDLRLQTDRCDLQVLNLMPGFECWEFSPTGRPGFWSNGVWD